MFGGAMRSVPGTCHFCMPQLLILLSTTYLIDASCKVELKILDLFKDEVSVLRVYGRLVIRSVGSSPLKQIMFPFGDTASIMVGSKTEMRINIMKPIFRKNIGEEVTVECVDGSKTKVRLPSYFPCSEEECEEECTNSTACVFNKDTSKQCIPHQCQKPMANSYVCLSDAQGKATSDTAESECEAVRMNRRVWAIVNDRNGCKKILNMNMPLQLATPAKTPTSHEAEKSYFEQGRKDDQEEHAVVNATVNMGQIYIIDKNFSLNTYQINLCPNIATIHCEMKNMSQHNSTLHSVSDCRSEGSLTMLRPKSSETKREAIWKITCTHYDTETQDSLGYVYFYVYFVDPWNDFPITCPTSHEHDTPECRWDLIQWAVTNKSEEAELLASHYYICSHDRNICMPDHQTVRSSMAMSMDMCTREKQVEPEHHQLGNLLVPDRVGKVTEVYVGSLSVELFLTICALLATCCLNRKYSKSKHVHPAKSKSSRSDTTRSRQILHHIDIAQYKTPSKTAAEGETSARSWIKKEPSWKVALKSASLSSIKRCESIQALKVLKIRNHLKQTEVEPEQPMAHERSHILGRQLMVRGRSRHSATESNEEVMDGWYGNLLLGAPWSGFTCTLNTKQKRA